MTHQLPLNSIKHRTIPSLLCLLFSVFCFSQLQAQYVKPGDVIYENNQLTGTTPQGIVFWVAPDGVSGLIVALQDASTSCQWLPSGNYTIPGITPNTNTTEVIADTAGYANTLTLQNYMVNNGIANKENYAAYKTAFNNGWYLPAAGQLNKLYAVLPEVNAALSAAGGAKLAVSFYWSSSQYGASSAWGVYCDGGYLSNGYVDYNYRVRSVRAFQLFDNSALSEPAGLVAAAGSQTANTIVYGNTEAANHTTANLYTMGGTVTYTAVEGTAHTGTGNTTVLVNDFINVASGDCRLAEASPLRDAGNTASIPAGLTQDLAGNARTQDNQVAIGAYQAVQLQSVCIKIEANPSNAGELMREGENCVTPGTQVTVRVTQVNSDYTFTNWTVEGVGKSTEEAYTFTASKDMTLVANFSEKSKYTVTLASNPVDNNEIRVSFSGQPQGVTSNDFYEGEKLHIQTNFSDRKYTFKNWTDGEGTEISTEPNFQYTVPAKAVILTANFTLRKYNITLETNPAGAGSVAFTDCSNPFYLDELVKATATANSGYEFVNWTVKDYSILISNNALMEFSALDNLTFTANFKTPQQTTYTVNIIAEPAEAFEMLLGEGTHIANSNIGLIAQVEKNNYKFVKWTNDLGEEFTENQIQDYILTGNRTFTAHAVPLIKYNLTITANPSEGGTISGTMNGNNIPNLNGTYTEGTRIWLNAQTSFDYEFVNWTENGNEISPNPNFEYTITKNADVKANFKKIEMYTITLQASPEEGGTVYFNGYNGPFMPEDHVEVSCYTNPRYELVNWTVDGVEVSTTPYYQFPATKSMTIVANFKEKVMYTINLQANPAEGGNINFIANSGPFIPGEPVEVRVNYENPAYLFINWTADNTEVSNEPYYEFSATKSMTLVANFMKIEVETTYTVTLDKNYPEAGIVLGGGKYIENHSVTLRAETNPGFMFKHWEVVSTGQELSTEPIYTFTLTQATAIKAVYAKLYTVTAAVAPENAGTISGTGTFAESTTVTLTTAPKAGYAFKNWTASGSQVSTAAAYSFQINSDTNLTAHFVSTNANLKSLSVNQGSLHVPFSPSVTNYTVNVVNSIDKITLTAEASHMAAVVSGHTGEQNLQVGKNIFTITVTAQDGVTQMTYTLEVIRQSANPSNDATLKSLTLSHGVLEPAFNPNTTEYTVTVADTVTIHSIIAEVNHTLATVNGHGERTLQLGENKVEITVTAEDGTQKVYTVTIMRTKLGINKVEQQALSVTIYPNPVNDVLHIKTDERIENATIYTIGGQQSMHLNPLNGNTINVSSLQAGMYILKLKTSKGEVINRFVKQ